MSGGHLDLDAIEARAKAATPGPWTAYGQVVWREGLLDTTDIIDDCACGNSGVERDTDGAHIAGMDPTATLALVAEVRRLRALVERATTVRNAWRNPRGEYGCEECEIWEDLDAALDRDHATPNA